MSWRRILSWNVVPPPKCHLGFCGVKGVGYDGPGKRIDPNGKVHTIMEDVKKGICPICQGELAKEN